MKPRHLVMGAALVVAAGFAIFGDNTPESSLAEPAPRNAAPAARPLQRVAVIPAGASQPAIARLIARAELVGDGADPMGGADNAFASQDWTPPPPPPQPAPPPPPPSAPALPFTYIGKAAMEGNWEVYLARAGQTYIVRNKMVIDGIYRVDAIAPPRLTLTYLPLNQVQQINIGVLD